MEARKSSTGRCPPKQDAPKMHSLKDHGFVTFLLTLLAQISCILAQEPLSPVAPDWRAAIIGDAVTLDAIRKEARTAGRTLEIMAEDDSRMSSGVISED